MRVMVPFPQLKKQTPGSDCPRSPGQSGSETRLQPRFSGPKVAGILPTAPHYLWSVHWTHGRAALWPLRWNLSATFTSPPPWQARTKAHVIGDVVKVHD